MCILLFTVICQETEFYIFSQKTEKGKPTTTFIIIQVEKYDGNYGNFPNCMYQTWWTQSITETPSLYKNMSNLLFRQLYKMFPTIVFCYVASIKVRGIQYCPGLLFSHFKYRIIVFTKF